MDFWAGRELWFGSQAALLTLAKRLKCSETQSPPSSSGDKNVPTLWGCEHWIARVYRALHTQVGTGAHCQDGVTPVGIVWVIFISDVLH